MEKELLVLLSRYLADLDEHNSKKSSIEEPTDADLYGFWRWLSFHYDNPKELT